jgi:hypothetical protein
MQTPRVAEGKRDGDKLQAEVFQEFLGL